MMPRRVGLDKLSNAIGRQAVRKAGRRGGQWLDDGENWPVGNRHLPADGLRQSNPANTAGHHVPSCSLIGCREVIAVSPPFDSVRSADYS